jgi:hypothetical protein
VLLDIPGGTSLDKGATSLGVAYALAEPWRAMRDSEVAARVSPTHRRASYADSCSFIPRIIGTTLRSLPSTTARTCSAHKANAVRTSRSYFARL